MEPPPISCNHLPPSIFCTPDSFTPSLASFSESRTPGARLQRETTLNKPFTKLSLTRLNTDHGLDLMTCHERCLSHSSWRRRGSYNHTRELMEICQRDALLSSLRTQRRSCFWASAGCGVGTIMLWPPRIRFFCYLFKTLIR